MNIIKTTQHKARRPHVCNYCGLTINSGEKYQRDFINNGDTYEWKSHIDCFKLTGELNMEGDYGITQEIFEEYVDEKFYELGFPDKSEWEKRLEKIVEYYKQKESIWI